MSGYTQAQVRAGSLFNISIIRIILIVLCRFIIFVIVIISPLMMTTTFNRKMRAVRLSSVTDEVLSAVLLHPALKELTVDKNLALASAGELRGYRGSISNQINVQHDGLYLFFMTPFCWGKWWQGWRLSIWQRCQTRGSGAFTFTSIFTFTFTLTFTFTFNLTFTLNLHL